MSDTALASTRHRSLRALRGTRPRSLGVPGWITVVTSAVILFWLSVPALVGFYDTPLPLAFALASLQCATLPLAVRFPRTAVLLHVAAIALIGAFTSDNMAEEFWPLPAPSLLALLVLLVVLGLREEWFVSVSAWWLSFLSMTLVVVVSSPELQTVSEWGVDVLVAVTVTLIGLAIAVFIGQRRRVRDVLAAARRDIELEQARRSAVEDRARIARELHDVVAHSMSIVHIQSESARFRVHDLDEAHAEFVDIARSARAALGEMRQLLEALHPDDDATYYAPQPTIADIPALIAGAEKVGSTVNYSNDVDADAISPLLQLTVYRIVQEALSNVIRHAPHAAVEVHLRADAHALDVEVRNAPAPDGAVLRRIDDNGGRGLRGMRERVALVHGDIEQGELPDGGYLVAARLPATPREESA